MSRDIAVRFTPQQADELFGAIAYTEVCYFEEAIEECDSDERPEYVRRLAVLNRASEKLREAVNA